MESPGADPSVITGPPAVPLSIPVPDYKDRSTALIVFGIVEILGGALAALIIPVMLLGMVFARKAGGTPRPGNVVIAVATYSLLAVVLVTLGIGAIMARRWARALNLILSWAWLILGIFVTIAITILTPSSFLDGMRTAAENNPNSGSVPTGVMAAVLTFFIVVAAVFLIFVPLAFLLFYRSHNVKETCHFRDPVERWTDRRPLPIITVALFAAIGAVYCVLIIFATPWFAFFGRYLTGRSAAIVFLMMAVANLYIAVSFLRLRISGWWVAVAMVTLQATSSVMTFARNSPIEAYSRLGWSEAQLQMFKSNPFLRHGALVWWHVVFAVAYLGFLIWLRRYFRHSITPSYTGLGDATSNPPQPGS